MKRFQPLSKAALLMLLILLAHSALLAQNKETERESLVITLHLMIANNTRSDDAKLPSSLESVAKQVREMLNASQVRLAMTTASRFESDRGISHQSSGQLHPPTQTPGGQVNLSYRISRVDVNDTDRNKLRLEGFSFQSRYPIFTQRSDGNYTANYFDMQISTNLSIKVGEPVIVGSINTTKPDESLVLVLVVKKVS